MLPRTLFLADCHLLPGPQPEQAGALRRTLAYAVQNATRLVFLGDTFHCWFERRGWVVGDYADVFAAFREAADAGLVMHHVSGNRDFAVGAGRRRGYAGFFRDGWPSVLADHGVEPEGPEFVLEQDGRRVHCTHGDRLCTWHLSYRLVAGGLRGWPGRYAGYRLPEWLVRYEVRRHQVRPVRKQYWRPVARLNITSAAAARAVAAGADFVLCGHVHHEDRRSLAAGGRTGELVIVPPWMVAREHAELVAGEVSIRTVPAVWPQSVEQV